jgi:CheY-like chemotaxis protein
MADRILIIDDDTYIRDLYEEILKGEGFDVVVAKDGEEGLNYLLDGGFAAVLLDVMMPKLDGIGVLTKLNESTAKKPNGPFLLLTNLDHDPLLDQAKSLGAYTHLIKADTLPPTLVTAVRNAIHDTSARSQPGQ